MSVVDVATIIVSAAGVIGWVTFPIAYHVRSRGAWMRHTDPLARETARLLMFVSVDIAAILVLVILARTVGDWPGRRYVGLALYAAFMVQPWWWLRVLWHARVKSTQEGE